jgi:hypothetical protein
MHSEAISLRALIFSLSHTLIPHFQFEIANHDFIIHHNSSSIKLFSTTAAIPTEF